MKLLYRIYRIVSWLRYAVPRRFTRAGIALLGALVVAAAMGPDTENNIAYQGFSLLFSILLISAVCCFFFRGRFSVSRQLPRFGTVGAPLSYALRVKNLTGRPQNGLVLLENLVDPRPSYAEWRAGQRAEQSRVRSFRFSRPLRANPFKKATLKEAPLPALPPNQPVEATAELTPLRRGVLRLAGTTVARADPLGLIRSFARVNQPQSVLILPKRYLLPPIALPGSHKYQQGGVAQASSVGQSEEFVSLRDYRHGDPVRHIHWRSWAKAGKPVVKEFEDEFFVRHALVLDTFTDHPHSELFEEAVSVAASFACTIQTQESLLDLLFVGTESYCFTAGRGLAHADQMLEILASVQPCPDKPFGSLETLVLNHAALVSGCVCVLLAWDEARQEFVRKLRALRVPVLVLVLAEAGTAKSIAAGILEDDPGHFHVLEAGRVEQALATLT